MVEKRITPAQVEQDADQALFEELEEAKKSLLEAEAELAREQAAVNAFRMHCRLKLDRWIENLMELQAQRQSLMTRLALLRQAEHYGIPFEEDDPFWTGENGEDTAQIDDELILPTDVPLDKAAEKRLYRQLAQSYHPDLGRNAMEIAYRTEMMAAVNQAYAENDIQGLYDLADQLDPEQAVQLTMIASIDERKIHQQINRLRRRRRKAIRRLKMLRKENTARLWQKAQYLERGDTHWWEIVRRELETAIEHHISDIEKLKLQIEPFDIEGD